MTNLELLQSLNLHDFSYSIKDIMKNVSTPYLEEWLMEETEKPNEHEWCPIIDTETIRRNEKYIVTVVDSTADKPIYYTTDAWFTGDYWISDNDMVCGNVIAYRDFPKPYKG